MLRKADTQAPIATQINLRSGEGTPILPTLSAGEPNWDVLAFILLLAGIGQMVYTEYFPIGEGWGGMIGSVLCTR